MSMRKSTITLLLATLLASAAFAADVAQPETPGSEGPKAAAEAKHLAKPHGLNAPKQVQAQTAGSEKAQAVAEKRHLKKKHGNINDSADQRLEKDHPNH